MYSFQLGYAMKDNERFRASQLWKILNLNKEIQRTVDVIMNEFFKA